jgi:intracellular multiplication protein IcmQ
MSVDNIKQKQKLVELVRDAITRDQALREKYQMGDKFRFVRDRLHALLDQLEKHVEHIEQEEKKSEVTAGEDETLVYIYLYNSHGASLNTWINMLTPKLFYEYSVNRPIYLEKAPAEALIRSKSNPIQHAFLTVVIKQKDIIQNENIPKDILGNQVVKVKEGSLRFERLLAITHNNQDYNLSVQGTLVKK